MLSSQSLVSLGTPPREGLKLAVFLQSSVTHCLASRLPHNNDRALKTREPVGGGWVGREVQTLYRADSLCQVYSVIQWCVVHELDLFCYLRLDLAAEHRLFSLDGGRQLQGKSLKYTT